MTRTPPSYELEPIRHEEGDLSDLLSELRILLPGAQMLTGFLIVLPFSSGAHFILGVERAMFLATLFCALGSLVLLSAPAIQHRLMRPLACRLRFKKLATRQIVAGSIALGCAFSLGTCMVLSAVIGDLPGGCAGAAIALLIASLWWALPLYLKRRRGY